MENEIEKVCAISGQHRLLEHWRQLDAVRRRKLGDQIGDVDFAAISRAYEKPSTENEWLSTIEEIEPAPAARLSDPETIRSRPAAIARGEAALAAGKVGMVLVAGGQGTRLGFPHPKGMFPLGPISGRTLFEILLQKLNARGQRYGREIPLYLMTSPATHDETIDFLSKHDWFGLSADACRVFRQGTLPAVDADTGQALLESLDALALSPDGHGGMLSAIAASGCLTDAKQREIEQLFYCQIDNPMTSVCDPELIGRHILHESEMTTLVVAKDRPDDRLGNVVRCGDRVRMIEYSELPSELAEQRDAEGGLRFWAGSIAVHVFEMSFLERAAAAGDSLPLHRALKKVPYVDGDGNRITPDAPNAIKFERFIFDLLPHAKNPIVVEGAREDVFAPVKNAAGEATETADTAQQAMIAQHRRWLAQAGVTPKAGVRVEINPLFAQDASELSRKMAPETTINEDGYIS
jgi:UDP-N-acetylglucosamine/UDP-N-acetylgalactosamine diphosphorylase